MRINILIKFTFMHLNPTWPRMMGGGRGGGDHAPSYKKCYNFRKANGIDFKFYDFS